MSNSPVPYLKRKCIHDHTRGSIDRYQEGVHHSHGEDLADTTEQERSQNTWPNPSPDAKGLESSDLPV